MTAFLWTEIEIKTYADDNIVIEIENVNLPDWNLRFWNLSENNIWNWSQSCLA